MVFIKTTLLLLIISLLSINGILSFQDPCNSPNVNCNLNNSICLPTYDGSYKCQCLYGYTGKTCNEIDYCIKKPCLYIDDDEEDCINKKDGYECICSSGYTGVNCTVDIDECKENPNICKNGGKCINKDGFYTCQCKGQFTGPNCEYKVTETLKKQKCFNGGVFDSVDGKCSCIDGFEGPFCEKQIQQCVEGLCLNGGICRETFDDLNCYCPEGYEGEFCETPIDFCNEDYMCKNGGTCLDNKNGSFRCLCPYGLTGKFCEINIDDCGDNECYPGSVCIDMVASYKCQCSEGRFGRYCQFENPCYGKNPCQNDGYCESFPYDGKYKCHCNQGFEGGNCENDIDECERNPMVCNKGRCVNVPGSFNCECHFGYNGTFCNDKVDLCAEMRCASGASCLDFGSYAECICPSGFKGDLCQEKIKSEAEEWTEMDNMMKKICYNNGCENKARNGICDEECNYFSCGYDGGDCTGNVTLYKYCENAFFCSSNANNGGCDEMCNTQYCLFDGGDCHPKLSIKEKELNSLCSGHYANGICEPKCNITTFYFDGGDCLVESKPMDETVYLVFNMTVGQFMEHKSTLLQHLSRAIRGKVSIINSTDTNLPSIKPFNLKNNTEIEGKVIDPKQKGVIVNVAIDNTPCLESGQENYCYNDIEAVEEEFGSIAKRHIVIDQEPLSLAYIRAEKISRHPPGKKSHTPFWVIFLPIICITALVFSIVGIVIRDRKRKHYFSNVWRPLNTDGTPSLPHTNFTLTSKDLYPAKKPNLAGTAIHDLIENRNGKTEEMIINEIKRMVNCGVNINEVNGKDETILIISVRKEMTKVVEALLRLGADPTLSDDQEMTPLHHAAMATNIAIGTLLCQSSKVDIESIDFLGRTPLKCCVFSDTDESLEFAKLLFSMHCDPNNSGKKSGILLDGKAPLHIAAETNNTEIIEYLIDHGANKDAGDVYDQTPLFIAAKEGNLAAVKCLLNKGASKEITDQQDKTPRDIAMQKHFEKIVKVLEVHIPMEVKKSSESGYAKVTCGRKKRKYPGSVSNAPTNGGTIVPNGGMVSSNSRNVKNTLSPLTPPISDGSSYSKTPSPSHPPCNKKAPTSYMNMYPPLPQPNSGPSILSSPLSDNQYNGGGLPMGNFVREPQQTQQQMQNMGGLNHGQLPSGHQGSGRQQIHQQSQMGGGHCGGQQQQEQHYVDVYEQQYHQQQQMSHHHHTVSHQQPQQHQQMVQNYYQGNLDSHFQQPLLQQQHHNQPSPPVNHHIPPVNYNYHQPENHYYAGGYYYQH
uniref:Neurogenic locus notch homolog protein 1 (inferred by orthology to a zebrafish protein) n=1 Tax=Strongyloides venezuelensis TaxID=75913 RepID=A0A0K0G355_STRVS